MFLNKRPTPINLDQFFSMLIKADKWKIRGSLLPIEQHWILMLFNGDQGAPDLPFISIGRHWEELIHIDRHWTLLKRILDQCKRFDRTLIDIVHWSIMSCVVSILSARGCSRNIWWLVLYTGRDPKILNLLLIMFWFAVHGRSTPNFPKQIPIKSNLI